MFVYPYIHPLQRKIKTKTIYVLSLVHTEDTKNRQIQENLESHEAILIFAKRPLPKCHQG